MKAIFVSFIYENVVVSLSCGNLKIVYRIVEANPSS